ncbi:MAG: D-alanyl-D-alanine carboxypeptidase family protein, partial [Burkholderiaceae bacterium]
MSARLNSIGSTIAPLITAALFITLSLSASPGHSQAWPVSPKIAAPSWMLIDATTGQTLASSNPESRFSPASMAKMMTAYLTFTALRDRKIRLDQNVPSPAEAEVPQGSRMFLLPGKNVMVSELLQGMITLGAHDAAIALAKA